MNIELLQRVKERILQEPRQFIMGYFFRREVSKFGVDLPREVPNCGTAACIAGWAICLHRGEKPREVDIHPGEGWWDEQASEILGISEQQGVRLFSVDYWPSDAIEAWLDAKTLEERAKVAAKRIDRFIATEKEEVGV